MFPFVPLCYTEGMNFESEHRPLHLREQRLPVAAGDCLTGLRMSLPALTDLLQEAAGCHAEDIGVGLPALQATGVTWMLGRLSVRLFAQPVWRDELLLTTWPSGVRGRLIAERQFVIERASDGTRIAEASSEWLCVSLETKKLARLPPAVAALAHPDTPNFGLCLDKMPAAPAGTPVLDEIAFPVRRAEIDANRHVNNVHYLAWMRETLPEDRFFGDFPIRCDIEYRTAATLGDTVTSRTFTPDPTDPNLYRHEILRADGTLLARAAERFAPRAKARR